ncbi:hypothetical protein V8E55_010500 [Tylopilus felleus]
MHHNFETDDIIDACSLPAANAEHCIHPQSSRKSSAAHPLLAWVNDRDTYLQEMVCLEGRAQNSGALCPLCHAVDPRYRCEDCLGHVLYCSKCVLDTHTLHPLHVLKMWNGKFFETVSLKALGLCVQLGHNPSHPCHNPKRCFDDTFVIIDTTGIHSISLDFCNCEHVQSQFKQLLRFAWFLATTSHPRSAATFRVLEQYHLLSLESKISAYEFYAALSRLMDNTGLVASKNRYESFLWTHAQFVVIDANFRLKRKKVSKDTIDPSLSKGWAYFVEDTTYKDYLAKGLRIPQEKSTCSSHLAVNRVDTLNNHGLAATGVGTVDCACHNMKLPIAVGDLQKGERYNNMDYLFFSAMCHISLSTLNISYNIACQWSKHIWTWMTTLPPDLQLDLDSKHVTFFVLKGWANINPAASSTKEMGPGARQDILDDHFGHWNWKKGFELMLPSKVVETLPCDHVTPRIEWRLRLAQAHDALNSLRSSLCARSFVWKFKDKNLRGQGANTRAQNTLKGIKAHINRAANKYNEARHTLSTLSSPLNETSWASVLCPLQVQDIRGMSDLLWGETEGTQKLSWIWSMHGLADDTTDETGAIEGNLADFGADIHIEWCKARARAHHWAKEVDLLLEEMRRTAVFFDWEVACWQRRAVEFTSNDPCLLEGFPAYAL